MTLIPVRLSHASQKLFFRKRILKDNYRKKKFGSEGIIVAGSLDLDFLQFDHSDFALVWPNPYVTPEIFKYSL